MNIEQVMTALSEARKDIRSAIFNKGDSARLPRAILEASALIEHAADNLEDAASHHFAEDAARIRSGIRAVRLLLEGGLRNFNLEAVIAALDTAKELLVIYEEIGDHAPIAEPVPAATGRKPPKQKAAA